MRTVSGMLTTRELYPVYDETREAQQHIALGYPTRAGEAISLYRLTKTTLPFALLIPDLYMFKKYAFFLPYIALTFDNSKYND